MKDDTGAKIMAGGVATIMIGTGVFLLSMIATDPYKDGQVKQTVYDGVVTSVQPMQYGDVLVTLKDGTTFKARLGNKTLTIGKENHIVCKQNVTHNTEVWIESVQCSK